MAVFVSCSTETVIDPIVVPMADVTLNVTNEEGSSRYIYLPTQNGGFQVDWSVGDKITLLYNKHNGTETVWKAVNLELITNNGDGNVVFSGKVPADYGGTYIGVYPAMNPKADGNQPYEVKAGKVYNDIQGGKSAIVQYFTDILKNTQQVQVNDNDMRHVEALDYQVTNCEFKCVENNGNRVLRNATMEPITFKHVFSFAKMSISKSKLPRGAYPIGISLAGYWGSYGTPVKDVEYSVLLEGNFQNNSDKLTFWMVMPEGKLDPGKSLKFTVYALPMREEFTFAIAKGHTVISGIDNVKAKVYNYDIDKFTPSHVQSLFYAWGNLDGYDSRVDPHKFSVNNCGLKGKKEYDIERYLKGFTAEKTGILDGKFSFAGLLDPKPKNIGNVWANDPANIGQPLGIGDPAAYWSNGVLHTPTKTEWEKLLNLAGINGSGNPIKDYHNTATGELANRVGGHDTDFWVAEDKDGQPI
ncbi:MAG: hypothetical protein HUK05_08680, partial [Prevotella sp.]|nr:hypothetical protein [Prevotella sp.]